MILYSSISILIWVRTNQKYTIFVIREEKKTIVEILLKNFKLQIKDLQVNWYIYMLCYFPWSYCSRFIQSNFLFFPIIILRAIESFSDCSSDYLRGFRVSLRTSEFCSISKNSSLGFVIHFCRLRTPV